MNASHPSQLVTIRPWRRTAPAGIEDYGFVADGRTAALVSRDGSVDWLCLPRLDSPACFAALLGGPEHGRFLLAPTNEETGARRHYRGASLILDSEIETGEGSVRVTDFMPPRRGFPTLVRIVEGTAGRVPMRAE